MIARILACICACLDGEGRDVHGEVRVGSDDVIHAIQCKCKSGSQLMHRDTKCISKAHLERTHLEEGADRGRTKRGRCPPEKEALGNAMDGVLGLHAVAEADIDKLPRGQSVRRGEGHVVGVEREEV